MKTTKKFLAMLICVAIAVCFFAGCSGTTPEPTPEETPEATPEATATPEPTVRPSKTPKPTPEPTPEPTPQPDGLYTWEYREYEDGKIDVAIVIAEGVDVKDIKIVEVPAEIDGKKVTKLPWDIFGARSVWGGRVGFMSVSEWDENGKPTKYGEGDCWVEKVIFPDTIEIIENDIFWFGPPIKEVEFKGTDNIVSISDYALAHIPWELKTARANGGFIVINGILEFAQPKLHIVLPDNVVETTNRVLHDQDFSFVQDITINDGCKKIGRNIINDAKNVQWIWIPDSVEEIVEYLCDDSYKSSLTVRCNAGSYADTWARANGYNVDNGPFDQE